MTTMDMAMAAPSPPPHPVTFNVEYPERLSRLLIFVKWLLAIPHVIVLYFLGLVFSVTTLLAFFAILFTRKYPEGLFKFGLGYERWAMNVNAYLWLLRDEYPPFALDSAGYPASFDVRYDAEMNRWLPLLKWLLALPHYIVLAFLGIAAWLMALVGWFAILFTGRMPRTIFDFIVGVLRYNQRVTAYVYLMTDSYPPFSLEA